MERDKIFEFIKKVNAISHIGLTYSKDEYAIDNYNELIEESTRMLQEYINMDIQPYDIYAEQYYPTPQPVVRVFVVKDDKILFVKEAKEHDTGKWSLPGGWCDVGTSPADSAVKEVVEESGYEVKITKLLGIGDRKNYIKSKMYDTYNIYFLAEIVGGSDNPNFEVMETGWFDFNELPELSTKTTEAEIRNVYQNYLDGKDTYFE